LKTLPCRPVGIEHLVFSPDGKRLAAASVFDGLIELIDVSTGKECGRFQALTASAVAPTFSRDGRTLAAEGVSGQDRNTIVVWDVTTGKQPRRISTLAGPDTGRRCVALTSDGTALASAGWDPRVQIWDVRTGQERLQPDALDVPVANFAFAPDGKAILSTGDDDCFRYWELPTGKLLRKRAWPYGAFTFSPDGKILATGLDELKLLRLATGKWLPVEKGARLGGSMTFSPDGKLIATTWGWTNVAILDATTGKKLHRLNVQQHPRSGSNLFTGLEFSPDGKVLAVGATQGFTLWDPGTGKRLPRPPELKGWVWSFAFAPDGKTLAVTDGDKQWVQLTDWPTGKARLAFGSKSDGTLALAFSPDGKTVATWVVPLGAGGKYEKVPRDEGVISLWEVATGRRRAQLPGHTGRVTSVSFSADGRFLASRSTDGTALFWDILNVARQPAAGGR
jgi:WD40 repeat protein